jgi:hypothetical protein
MRLLINFRRATPSLNRTGYVTEKDIQWHGEVGCARPTRSATTAAHRKSV